MRFSIVMTCCLFLASFSLHASPCTLTVNAVITEGCRQAGFVQVEVLVKSESANSEGFNVFADGILVSGSPFKYDVSGNTTLRVFLSCVLPMHQIFVHDMNDVACTGITPIECPDF